MFDRRFSAAFPSLLAAIFLAGVAHAQQTLPMTGQWFRNSGPLVDIPINGGPVLCGGPVQTGCVNNFRPLNGGVPATSNATGQVKNDDGIGPATFTLPPDAFTQNLGTQIATVAVVPTVVQLTTQFSIHGPVTEAPGANPDRILRPNAWTGQTGRLAADFAWCPGTVMAGTPASAGPGVVGCTNPIPSIGGGAYNGLVKYTGGANAFGGTMALFLAGPGTVSVIVGTTGGIPLLGHSIIGGMMTQQGGQGYAAFDTVMLASGPINLGFMQSPTNMFITTSGPTVAAIPADKNYNWGFPFTTGTVFVQNVQTNQGQAGTTTISEMGSDSRTLAGVGNITLVAGSTVHRALANQDFAGLDIVVMNFLPEPGATLMLGASLAAIGALYRLRRRG
jgi:hypothetical protein